MVWESVRGAQYRVDERIAEHFLDQLISSFNCLNVSISIKLTWLVSHNVACDHNDIDLIVVVFHQLFLKLLEQNSGSIQGQVTVRGSYGPRSVSFYNIITCMTASELAARSGCTHMVVHVDR